MAEFHADKGDDSDHSRRWLSKRGLRLSARRGSDERLQQISEVGRFHTGVSVKVRIDAVSSRSSNIGMPRYCMRSAGPPRSRTSRATAVARPPTALSPPTASRAGSMPSSAECLAVQAGAA